MHYDIIALYYIIANIIENIIALIIIAKPNYVRIWSKLNHDSHEIIQIYNILAASFFLLKWLDNQYLETNIDFSQIFYLF